MTHSVGMFHWLPCTGPTKKGCLTVKSSSWVMALTASNTLLKGLLSWQATPTHGPLYKTLPALSVYIYAPAKMWSKRCLCQLMCGPQWQHRTSTSLWISSQLSQMNHYANEVSILQFRLRVLHSPVQYSWEWRVMIKKKTKNKQNFPSRENETSKPAGACWQWV